MRIKLQWKRPEEGREEKDVARLQMMLSLLSHGGVKLVT